MYNLQFQILMYNLQFQILMYKLQFKILVYSSSSAETRSSKLDTALLCMQHCLCTSSSSAETRSSKLDTATLHMLVLQTTTLHFAPALLLCASFHFHNCTAIITQNGIIRFVFVMRTDCVLSEVEAHAADTQRFSLVYVSRQQYYGDLEVLLFAGQIIALRRASIVSG
jgi:hypothetical protein